MANEISKVFNSEKFGNVRVAVVDGEPWFVGKDICDALDIRNSRDAMARIDNDEKSSVVLTDGSQGRNMGVVNEYGVYSLIMTSRKSEAREFKRWITHDVLPSIRKTGSYGIPQTYAEALQLAADQAKQLLEQKPKVEFFDAVAESKDAIEIASVAKVLNVPGVGRNKLFEFLRNHKVLMRNNQPYQKYVDCGYFRIVEQKYERPNGDTCINIKTLVYQKGVKYIQELLKSAHT